MDVAYENSKKACKPGAKANQYVLSHFHRRTAAEVNLSLLVSFILLFLLQEMHPFFYVHSHFLPIVLFPLCSENFGTIPIPKYFLDSRLAEREVWLPTGGGIAA